jgi:hypothetical protein
LVNNSQRPSLRIQGASKNIQERGWLDLAADEYDSGSLGAA